jgi:photosystem II stability/assembly factor-like uncharacterized protein
MVKISALVGVLLLAYTAPVFAGSIDIANTTLKIPSILIVNPQISLYNAIALAGDRLVAVGEGGRIILSDDNGVSWRQVETPTSVTLTNVRFASPTTGWATGNMGVILQTVDAGRSWHMQFDGVQANQALLAAAQADAASATPDKATAQANLLSVQEIAGGGPSNPFLDVLPLSAQNLMIVGAYGMAFTSTNGGQSFQPITDAIPNPNGLHIYKIIQDGDQLILAGEQGLLLARNAAGVFTTLTSTAPGTFFGGMKSAGGAMLVYGLQGMIMRSMDDGKTWQQVTSPTNASIDCGIILKDGTILLGDQVGDILLSKDDGKNFSMTVVGEPVVALAQAADGAIVMAGSEKVSRMDPHLLEPRA